jgi:hypothetical protein
LKEDAAAEPIRPGTAADARLKGYTAQAAYPAKQSPGHAQNSPLQPQKNRHSALSCPKKASFFPVKRQIPAKNRILGAALHRNEKYNNSHTLYNELAKGYISTRKDGAILSLVEQLQAQIVMFTFYRL